MELHKRDKLFLNTWYDTIFSSSLCGLLGILHLASHNITDKHKRRSYSKQPQECSQIMSGDKQLKLRNVTHTLQLFCLT